MDRVESLKRIYNHVFFGDLSPSETNGSFSYVLWEADRRDVMPDYESQFDDLLAALTSINISFNKEKLVHGEVSQRSIPEDLMRCYSSIMREGIEYAIKWRGDIRIDNQDIDMFEITLWQIALCFEAVLAGDIDDLHEHIRTEAIARDIPI